MMCEINRALQKSGFGLCVLAVILLGSFKTSRATSKEKSSVANESMAQQFSWNKDRQLSWKDFKGAMPNATPDRVAAETSCGIGFETNFVNGMPKVSVYNMFEATSSWVRPGVEEDDVLQHEQGHFDLCELYTRKMRERFHNAHITARNMQQVLRTISNAVEREYETRQQQYEQQTQHGTIVEKQQNWSGKIASELAATEAWASK